MNSVYKMSENKERLDFSAMKIFFSVIAIFLSVTMPNAQAVTENSSPYQRSVLSNIISELKTRKTEPGRQVNENKSQCGLQKEKSASTKSSAQFVNFGSDFMCPVPGSSKDPNES